MAPGGEDIIDAILREEEEAKTARKKQKAQAGGPAKRAGKGIKPVAQVEEEDEGAIQESRVDRAHKERADRRRGGKDADTTLLGVSELERAEVELTAHEEDGIKLEPFNLKEERARGHFDAAGNYVEDRAGSSDEEANDEWLKSGEATVVSEAVRQRLQEQERAAAQADRAGPGELTATQIARLQHEAARLMEPGETVAGALRRMGAGLARRGPKRSRPGTGAAEPAAPVDPGLKARFDRLTEIGVNLMEAGETDVYTQTKEYFARAAAVYIDADEGPSTLFGAGAPPTTAYDDADEDMFASGDDEDGDARRAADDTATPVGGDASEGVVQRDPGLGPQTQPSGGTEPSGPDLEASIAHYSSWPIKELRRLLQERGIDPAGFVEKQELVAKAAEVAGTMEHAAGEKPVPQGYCFDPASGYYFSQDTGMYWDRSSGGFHSSETGKWYVWDGVANTFQEWK